MAKLSEMKSAELLSLYVTFLRALYHIHQNAHWKTSGENFYGNHLVFQRLYEATQENADMAAEKTIGLYNGLLDMPEKFSTICSQFNADNFDNNYALASLKAEQAFLQFSQLVYDQLKSSGAITLGLDDMIMAIASKSEVHVYLLKQIKST